MGEFNMESFIPSFVFTVAMVLFVYFQWKVYAKWTAVQNEKIVRLKSEMDFQERKMIHIITKDLEGRFGIIDEERKNELCIDVDKLIRGRINKLFYEDNTGLLKRIIEAINEYQLKV